MFWRPRTWSDLSGAECLLADIQRYILLHRIDVARVSFLDTTSFHMFAWRGHESVGYRFAGYIFEIQSDMHDSFGSG